MRLRSSALVLCLVAAAGAQEKADEKLALIEGIVTNALTGAPILRAHVVCDGFTAGKPLAYGALTDAEGKFSIKNLPAANYSVTVERIGFVMPFESGRRGVSFALRAGDSKPDVRLKLTPTGAILGRVVDADGNPMEGLRVIAETGGGVGGPRGTMAVTDEKGQYRIGALEPGRYRVRATRMGLPLPPEIRTDGSEEVRLVSTYHPAAVEAKSAPRLEIRSGADLTGVDIKMQRLPMVRISGVVTGIPAGAPPHSTVVDTRTEGMGGQSQVVGADGKFEIWNPDPGKWVLTAVTSSRDQSGPRSAGVEIEVGAQHVDNVELRMMAPFDVAGQLVFESDVAKPRPQGQNGPVPRMALQEVIRVGGQRGTQPIIPSEDGAFRFVGVAPGKYRFNYGWRASIRSVRVGTVEMPDHILDLTNGTGGAPVMIEFGPALGQIRGTVRDEKGPVPNARVVLRNPSISVGSTNGAYRTVTATDGTYALGNIPDGRYILVSPEENDAMNDTFEDYEEVAVPIEIRGADRKVQDLKRNSGGGR